MAKRSGIDGMADLERTFKRLGKVPQTVVSKSARAGGGVILKETRSNAPVDEGNLKRGLVLKRERTRVKGKAVYQVTFDNAMNNVFVKVSKDGKRSYYPASQEYGYLTVDGKYIPGYRYMRNSAEGKGHAAERKMLEVAGKAVEKAMRG